MHHCHGNRTLKHKRNKPQNSSGQMEHVREAGTGCRLRATSPAHKGYAELTRFRRGDDYFPQSDG